jgi:hypothetical protein
LIDILFEKLGVLLNGYFFFSLLFGSRLRNNLIVRLADINFNNRVINQRGLIIAKGDEDDFLVHNVRSEP